MRHLNRSIRLWHRVGNRTGLGWALIDRSRLRAHDGRTRAAEDDLREAVLQCESTSDPWLASRVLEALRRLLEATDREGTVRELLERTKEVAAGVSA